LLDLWFRPRSPTRTVIRTYGRWWHVGEMDQAEVSPGLPLYSSPRHFALSLVPSYTLLTTDGSSVRPQGSSTYGWGVLYGLEGGGPGGGRMPSSDVRAVLPGCPETGGVSTRLPARPPRPWPLPSTLDLPPHSLLPLAFARRSWCGMWGRKDPVAVMEGSAILRGTSDVFCQAWGRGCGPAQAATAGGLPGLDGHEVRRPRRWAACSTRNSVCCVSQLVRRPCFLFPHPRRNAPPRPPLVPFLLLSVPPFIASSPPFRLPSSVSSPPLSRPLPSPNLSPALCWLPIGFSPFSLALRRLGSWPTSAFSLRFAFPFHCVLHVFCLRCRVLELSFPFLSLPRDVPWISFSLPLFSCSPL